MKIKKTKRLLALILCMALVLGTNTFTMAAGAGQTQEESLQEQENISQEEILQEPEESSPEEAGTEAVQAQALETEEIIEEEPQEEAQERPQGEEIQKDSMGETEEAATEDDGQGETAETNGEENVTEETEDETAGDMTETTVPEDGTAENELGSENTAQDNDQGKDSQIAEAGEKQENGTTAGEVPDQEEIDEQETDQVQELQYEDEYVFATATVPRDSFDTEVTLQIGYGDEDAYKEIGQVLSNTIVDNEIVQCAIQDISFVDINGNMVEPAQNVEVQITYKQPIGTEREIKKISAYHMVTDTEMYAVNLEETGELLQIDTSDGKTVNGFTVSCNSFSPFVLAWESEKIDLKTTVITNAGPVIENMQMAPMKAANALLTGTQEEQSDEEDGVKLSKTAEATDDGQYKIRLEAYTTGTVTNTEESTPADIILVLDQSGSMGEDFGEGRRPPSRQDAMQSSVKSFISQVADANEENRIGIITFASSANVLRTLQNAKTNEQSLLNSIDWLGYPSGATNVADGMEEAVDMLPAQVEGRNRVVIVFTDGVPTTSSNYATSVADSAIAYSKQIKDSGATVYTVGIFEGANPEQLYLEGNGRRGEIGESWDNDTSGETAAANRYMNYLSSNYKDAQSDGLKEIIEGWLLPRLAGWKIEQNYSRTTTDEYYLSAADADDLEDIFEAIADQVTTPSIELGEDAYIQDIISDVFELPKGVNSENIGGYVTVMTSRKTANGWTKETELPTAEVELLSDGKTIQVKGFNFDENVISEDPRENPNDPNDKEFYGQKLIIEFNVQPEENFIGGNAVETNADNSAIYDSEDTHIKEFPKPTVNVPINYEYRAEDKSIYIGDSWNQVEQFFDNIAQEGIQYQKSENGIEYTLDGKNNRYVDITYTIKNQIGEEIGTYKVRAGEITGSWEEGQPNINTEELVDCTKYTITANITSKNEPALGDNKGSAKNITDKVPYNNETPEIHVFVPKISVKDQKIFMGESVNLNDSVQYKGPYDWVDVGAHTTISSPDNDSPALKFEFENVSGTALGSGEDKYENYVPEEDSNFNLKVQREDTQKDITEPSKIMNSEEMECDDCYKPDKSDVSHFTIHVVAGKVEIKKEIDKKGISAIEGDSIFTFKIEYQPVEGVDREAQVYYRTIRFTGNNETNTKTAELLEGLPKGDYTVTELTTQKYQFAGSDAGDSTCSVERNGEKTVIFHIGEETENIKALNATTGIVTYTNNKTDASTNTDTDTIVNRYVYDEKTKTWKVSQIKVPGENQEEIPVYSGTSN